MIKPLSQLNAFFSLAEERMLKGSDQLLYLHLFNLFNRAHWSETICVTDNDLMSAMRLYDSTGKPAHVNTIRNAKSRLKLKGFIDFKPGKGSNSTVYKLIQLYPCDTLCDTPCDTACDTPCDTLRVYSSYPEPSEEDVKTKDAKTEEETAREVLGVLGEEVERAWKAASGAKLGGEQITYLASLKKAKGAQFVIDAIKDASIRNNYANFPNVTFNFLKMTIDEKLKGSENNGRNDAGRNGGDRRVERIESEEWEDEALRKFLDS